MTRLRLVVVGGGITGLAAAHRAVELARERAAELELILVEAGPDSFLSEKPWALALCRRLGVEDRLVRTDDRFRKVFVWHAGRLHALPDGFQLLAPTKLGPFVKSSLFSWPGKLRMALDLVKPRGTSDDQSLGAFVRRRLGREALERVAQPLVAGIYTADPDDLSLSATMPRFSELERRERSIILALWRANRRAPQQGTSGARWSLFVTFRNGMEELVTELASRLPPGAVVLKHRVDGLERSGRGWRVAGGPGPSVEADHVIVATESYTASRLLRYVEPALATLLGEIPYASSATITFGFRRADVPHPLDGFGVVVPRTERRAVFACTFASVKYPGRAPEGHALLRCFVGGALNERMLESDDGALMVAARDDLRDMLGITAEPVLTRVARWTKAMPQYHVGHAGRVEALEQCAAALPGLHLAGGAYRGVGIADCVRSGEVAAERVFESGGRSRPPSR
jgi:oxygen-dependent protoporphyrinogen oxidase